MDPRDKDLQNLLSVYLETEAFHYFCNVSPLRGGVMHCKGAADVQGYSLDMREHRGSRLRN